MLLQTANILLGRDGKAKVADVGLAKILTREHTQVSMDGTFEWSAPEVGFWVRVEGLGFWGQARGRDRTSPCSVGKVAVVSRPVRRPRTAPVPGAHTGGRGRGRGRLGRVVIPVLVLRSPPVRYLWTIGWSAPQR